MATATLKAYDYESLDTTGRRVKGTVDASTQSAAAAALAAQGMVPLFIGEHGRGMNREITLPGFGSRVSLKELAIFSRQFATMTASGMPLLRSLAILEEQTEKAPLKKAIRNVLSDVSSGSSLSAAMTEQNHVFPPLMIAMIRAGETGGFLDSALDRIAKNLEKDAKLRSKIKAALTYPTIVLSFSALLVTGVLIFIVPVFTKMFKQLNAQLPLPTRIMVAISHQMWWLVPLGLVGLFGGMSWMRRRLRTDAAFRLRYDLFRLRLPVFGSLFTKISISRFSRNLGTLLSVGVPIMQALDIVGETTGNAVITKAMEDVKESVRAGQPISTPLAAHKVFPPMVVQMVEVGEESGQISAMLDKVADFYDDEVDAATEALASAIEPVMVVLMGAIVGTMVICLYLPMFTIYQHIQGATS